MPRVSVIIPAYNAAGTVGVAVDAVLSQTFEDYEVIVVDDGSVDATVDVVAVRSDDRLRYIGHANQGVSVARNEGLSQAAGEYVAFLDADDLWHERKLERQIEAIRDMPGAGFCFTSAELVDDRLQPFGIDYAPNFQDYCREFLVTGNVVPGGGSSAMVKRDLITSLGGFDPALSQCADWDMWLRLSLVTEFVSIRDPLTRYRKAPDTMSSNPALLERDTFFLLDKFFASEACAPYLTVRRRAYGNHWMICAGTYLHAGAIRDATRCVRHGLQADLRSFHRPLLLPARAASRRARGRRSSRTRAF
jgi:glycosyltransferase involved in cell wall biosynthesis